MTPGLFAPTTVASGCVNDFLVPIVFVTGTPFLRGFAAFRAVRLCLTEPKLPPTWSSQIDFGAGMQFAPKVAK
jgi:hypothetical protein